MSAQPPQPNLAWQFESSNVDSITGLAPNGGTFVPTSIQFAPTYVAGKYQQAINFNNTLLASGTAANSYVTYDVTSFGLSSNSGTMSLWLNSGLTYPITAGCNPYYISLQGTTYYSFQTAAAGRSSINLQTGSSPNVIISSAAQTGVWNHYCAVFSNVGTTGASNTASYFYFNGSLVGSGNTLSQAFTSLNLGAPSTFLNGALCSIDDLRLFNTALSAAQVQTIYAAQGMPNQMSLSVVSAGGTNAYMGGNPFFSSAVSATNSVVGYSLRALSGTYVKVVNVRNGTTSATQDFYADIFGNLTITGTGQSLADWLRGATGYAVTWYDQSGAGNNATQVTAANQPIIQKATNGPGYSLLFDGATQYLVGMSYTVLNGTNYSFSLIERRNSAAIMMAISSGNAAKDDGFHFGYYTGGTIVRFGQYSDDMDINPYPAYAGASEPVHYWVGTESSTSGRFLYENGTVSTSDATLKTLLSSVSGNFTIGARLFGSTYYYSGEIYEVLVWTSRSLTSSDVSKAYSDQSGYITGSKITSITLQ